MSGRNSHSRGDGNITAVKDGSPAVERVRIKRNVVSAAIDMSIFGRDTCIQEDTYYRFSRRDPWRIPEGPKRAPGRYDVPVSKGAPA